MTAKIALVTGAEITARLQSPDAFKPSDVPAALAS